VHRLLLGRRRVQEHLCRSRRMHRASSAKDDRTARRHACTPSSLF
jgi:hypothetical protein